MDPHKKNDFFPPNPQVRPPEPVAGVEEGRQLRDALTEIEERYRLLAELPGYGLFIAQGLPPRLVLVNQAFAEMLGYQQGELLEMKPEDVRALVVAEEREVFFGLYEKVIGDDPGPHNYEGRALGKDGRLRWLSVSASRVAYHGRPAVQAVVIDRTAHRLVERDLGESRGRYRAMVEAFDGMIYVCSRDYRVEFMNSRLIERTGCDGVGRLCYQVLHERQEICPWCVNDRVFKGETVRWEIQSPKDNRWFYVVNTPLYHADGTISKQALILDITDRKHMEEALSKTSENTRRFAYSVSHDLKNPALAIHGLARRLHDQYSEELGHKGQETCRYILHAAEHIAAMVEMINVYINTKEMPFLLEDVRLRQIVETLEEEFKLRLETMHVLWRGPDADPVIPADRVALLRAVRNLVDNALKYGGRQLSEIEVGYRPADGGHLISVRDDGVGLGQNTDGRLFDMFHRMESSRGVEGTGLGLAITKEVVEKHGGRIWHEGSAFGGTTFYLFFPAHAAE